MVQDRSVSAAKKRPVTVKAPIITDALTEEGAGPILDFIASLETGAHADIARAESLRLSPYFRALSAALHPEEGLAAPGVLSGLFTAVAAYTRNTLLSDVAVLPSNIGSSGPASDFFCVQPNLANGAFHYQGRSFGFSFVEVFEGGDKDKARSSVVFPIFLIDADVMKALQPHDPLPLLQDLQAVMSVVNHDPLHHFTAPLINSEIVHKFVDKKEPVYAEMRDWYYASTHAAPGNTNLYEEWAHHQYEKALRGAGMEKDLEKNVEHYFDELKRLGQGLPPAEARAVVDYCGMMMAHALSRIYPLNHPLMTRCLDRLRDADTAPEKAFVDFYYTTLLEWPHKEQEPLYRAPPEQVWARIRRDVPVDERWMERGDIVTGYKNDGFDILAENYSAAESYRKVKALELISISAEDARYHVPSPVVDATAARRAGAEATTLGFLRIAAKYSGYAPMKG